MQNQICGRSEPGMVGTAQTASAMQDRDSARAHGALATAPQPFTEPVRARSSGDSPVSTETDGLDGGESWIRTAGTDF
jgi:hypothetical protein